MRLRGFYIPKLDFKYNLVYFSTGSTPRREISITPIGETDGGDRDGRETSKSPLTELNFIPLHTLRASNFYCFTVNYTIPFRSLKANSHCRVRHDTDRTVLLCLAWRCELSRPDSQAGAFCVWSVSECVGRRSMTAGHTQTQNVLVGRSRRLSGHRHNRLDKTVTPACRPPPPRRRPGRQLRLAARPPRGDV